MTAHLAISAPEGCLEGSESLGKVKGPHLGGRDWLPGREPWPSMSTSIQRLRGRVPDSICSVIGVCGGFPSPALTLNGGEPRGV